MRKPPSPGRPSRANFSPRFCCETTPPRFKRQDYAFRIVDLHIRALWWSQRTKGAPLPVVSGIVIEGGRS